MKTSLLHHLKQNHINPCINEDLGLQSSLLRYQGWNSSKSTNTLRSNFWKKIKWNLKIYPLGINKNLLIYHLKQTSWQSMNKWRSFRTSQSSLLCLSGLNFFQVHKHTNIQFLEKVNWNFENLSPGNHENLFALSFKADFISFHA